MKPALYHAICSACHAFGRAAPIRVHVSGPNGVPVHGDILGGFDLLAGTCVQCLCQTCCSLPPQLSSPGAPGSLRWLVDWIQHADPGAALVAGEDVDPDDAVEEEERLLLEFLDTRTFLTPAMAYDMSQPLRSLRQCMRDAPQPAVWPTGSRLWVFNPQTCAWAKLKVESFNAGSGLYQATDAETEESTYTFHNSIHFIHWGDAPPSDIPLLPAELFPSAHPGGPLPPQGNFTLGALPHPTGSSGPPSQAPFAHHPGGMSGMYGGGGGNGAQHSAFTMSQQFGGPPPPMPPNYASSQFMPPPTMMMPGYGGLVPVPGPADSGMPFTWNPVGVSYAAASVPHRPTSPVTSFTQSHCGALPVPHHSPKHQGRQHQGRQQQGRQQQPQQETPSSPSPSPSGSTASDGDLPSAGATALHRRVCEQDASLAPAVPQHPMDPAPAAAAAKAAAVPLPCSAAQAAAAVASATPSPSAGAGPGAGGIGGEAEGGSAGPCRDPTPVSVWVQPAPEPAPAAPAGALVAPPHGPSSAAPASAVAAQSAGPGGAAAEPHRTLAAVTDGSAAASAPRSVGVRGGEESAGASGLGAPAVLIPATGAVLAGPPAGASGLGAVAVVIPATGAVLAGPQAGAAADGLPEAQGADEAMEAPGADEEMEVQGAGELAAEVVEAQGAEELAAEGLSAQEGEEGIGELQAWPQLPDPEGLSEARLGYHLCDAFMKVRRRLGLGFLVGGAITVSLLHCSHALRLEYFRELRARIVAGGQQGGAVMDEEEEEEEREWAVAAVLQAAVWRCSVAEAEAEMQAAAVGPETPSACAAPLVAHDSSMPALAV